jgi:replicative DNA helicase
MSEAVHQFYLDREGQPELIPFGISAVDAVIGGLGPRSCAIFAGVTGVGKSSTALHAMINSPCPVGMVSVEDGPDLIGTRLLSALTGIDSLRIRRKDVTKNELKRLQDVSKSNIGEKMFFSYPIAGTLDDVQKSVEALTKAGCKMIWLDYLQKVRGHNGDRRNEVSETFTTFQRACAQGKAAGIAVSQFRRLSETEKIPQIHHLKESGDLEIEARVIILAHRVTDESGKSRLRFRIAKSNYGGEGTSWDMARNEAGILQEVTFAESNADDGVTW